MALLDVDDLDEIFDTDEAAVEAYYTPTGKNANKVTVRFINQYEAVNIGLTEVDSAAPFARVKSLDFSSVINGETLKIESIIYTITASEVPTGSLTGILRLSED